MNNRTTIANHYGDTMAVGSMGRHIGMESRAGAFTLHYFMEPAQARELAEALLQHADAVEGLSVVEVPA